MVWITTHRDDPRIEQVHVYELYIKDRKEISIRVSTEDAKMFN